MSFLAYYAIFALTTTIVSLFELLQPVVQMYEDINCKQIENKIATYVAFGGISLLLAPFVFLSCIVPTMGETYRNALYKGIFPKP